MEENKANTVSVRIYEDTQTELLAEQARRKRSTGVKPTFADLIQESLATPADSPVGIPAQDRLAVADRQLVAHLIEMIRDGESDKLPAVKLLLKNYKPKNTDAIEEAAPAGGKHQRKSA